MGLLDFFGRREETTRKVVLPETAEVDLTVLLDYQITAVEELMGGDNRYRAKSSEETSFSSHVEEVLKSVLRKADLDFDVLSSGSRIYLQTPKERMLWLPGDRAKELLEKVETTRLMELFYEGSGNYVISIRSFHSWGFKASTQWGIRSFSWEKVEGLNLGLLQTELPFHAIYDVEETKNGFSFTWGLLAR